MSNGGTILIGNEHAKLKPCLRCGYALRGINSKNCPECGLAARISLNANTALQWSSPKWQRCLALGFAVLGVSAALRLLGASFDYLTGLFISGSLRVSLDTEFMIMRGSSYSSAASIPFAGLGLILLAARERRHPDQMRRLHRLAMASGCAIGLAGTFYAVWTSGLVQNWSIFVWHTAMQVGTGPWVALLTAVPAAAITQEIARRGDSRMLLLVFQLPLLVAGIAAICWLCSSHFAFRSAQMIILRWAFPAAMLVTVIPTINMLLRNAREAETNWISD